MFGMNMNNVAVTDGDRVEFEQRLGYHVDYYPVSNLMEYWKQVSDEEALALIEQIYYTLTEEMNKNLLIWGIIFVRYI